MLGMALQVSKTRKLKVLIFILVYSLMVLQITFIIQITVKKSRQEL